MSRKVIIAGAGAAGLIAAGHAAELGADVLVIEKMREAGKKILISGKERCNITNNAPLEKFITYYGRNGQFLRNAYHRFFRDELLALLRRYGVNTQVERGGRIFPASGRADEVRDALVRYATEHGATFRYLTEAQRVVVREKRVVALELWNGQRLPADAVILTTGGASWPGTGSTGDGYRMAAAVGHTVVPLRPALVPLTVVEREVVKEVQGVSLRNARCTFLVKQGRKEKPIRLPFPMPPTGEMLFTHFGVSGPLILTASLGVVDALRAGKKVTLSIDFKPGMSVEQVRARLQREFEQYAHRHVRKLLKGWLPFKLADLLARMSGIEPERHLYTIRVAERERLVQLLKDFRLTISGSLPLVAGMVTAGGVSLKEVHPLTFESRLISGLYLAGEILDLAADTGGFNLQAAFTGGYLAGQAAASGG